MFSLLPLNGYSWISTLVFYHYGRLILSVFASIASNTSIQHEFIFSKKKESNWFGHTPVSNSVKQSFLTSSLQGLLARQ